MHYGENAMNLVVGSRDGSMILTWHWHVTRQERHHRVLANRLPILRLVDNSSTSYLDTSDYSIYWPMRHSRDPIALCLRHEECDVWWKGVSWLQKNERFWWTLRSQQRKGITVFSCGSPVYLLKVRDRCQMLVANSNLWDDISFPI